MKRISTLLIGLFALSSLLVGCEGQNPDNEGEGTKLEGEISLLSNRSIIRANGTDAATLTVLLTDKSGMIHDVTSEAEIYDEAGSDPLSSHIVTASANATCKIYAIYGLAISNTVTIEAVSGIADLPADSDKGSTDFHHRALLIQHTGSTCPNCPTLTSRLKKIGDDEAYGSKYHIVASHSYDIYQDNAYSSSAMLLSGALNVHSYPWLTFNLTTDTAYEEEDIKSKIDAIHLAKADAAIAASASVVEGRIYAHVGVKAATSGNYRVAVWVLEDAIQATQSGATASWQHIHNNCLRYMVGENKTENIYGHNIGLVESGKEATYIASAEIDDKWHEANCKLIIIVTTDDGKGGFELVNCALCPVGGSVSYAYN